MMTPKRTLLVLLLSIAFAVDCAVVLLLGNWLWGIWPRPQQSAEAMQPLDLKVLLVESSVFPTGWYKGAGPSRVPKELSYESVDSLDVWYKHGEPAPYASQVVYRFRTADQAESKFRVVVGVEFHHILMTQSPEKPAGWSYRPPHADQFELGCVNLNSQNRDLESAPKCDAIVRYSEVVTVFFTPMSVDMDIADLESILQDIDSRMAKYVK